MVLAARLSAELGRAPLLDAARLAGLLAHLGLPIELPEGLSASICSDLLRPLRRFKSKIREVSINVKDFNSEKPHMRKDLQVLITMNTGEQYYIQKSNSSLLIASHNLAKAVKDLISNIINKTTLEKRKRMPIYLYNRE